MRCVNLQGTYHILSILFKGIFFINISIVFPYLFYTFAILK